MDTPSTQSSETITVQGQPPAAKSHLWAGDHFSFHDLLDAINPLQHIPVVSTIYREVTGDTLGNAARVVGDGLYGGVIGVIAGLLDVSVIEATGKDIGQHVIATVTGEDDRPTGAAPAAPASPQPVPAVPSPVAPADPAPASAEAVAAAPSTPGLQLAQATAQSAAPMMPLSNAPKLMSLNGPARSFAIDTSPEGILALRTTANSAPRPVPLNIPGGALAPSQRIPTTGAEFVQRMQEGLDKYKAMMAARAAAGTGAAIDQVQ